MKNIAVAVVLSVFASSSAFAQATCEAKSADGKMLSGAAKTASVKKCMG